MKRTDRMFAIVVDLQARGIQRAQDLAARYETSVRTIYRDVMALGEAGIPVISLPGQGYALPTDYFLPPLSLSPDEAFALLGGAEYVAQTLGPVSRAAANSAIAKIEAIVPLALRGALAQARRELRLVGRATPADQIEALLTVREAIAERRMVRFHYRGRRTDDATGRGEQARRVAPYALAHMSGKWYVVGYSPERDALRRFRLSRMDDVLLTLDPFALPPDFRLEPPDTQNDLPVLVRIAFDAGELPAMHERLAPFEATVQSDGLLCVAALRTHSELAMLGYVLSWGSAVVVLEPATLRERVVSEARTILERATDMVVATAPR